MSLSHEAWSSELAVESKAKNENAKVVLQRPYMHDRVSPWGQLQVKAELTEVSGQEPLHGLHAPITRKAIGSKNMSKQF
jgi:hypothetical protein